MVHHIQASISSPGCPLFNWLPSWDQGVWQKGEVTVGLIWIIEQEGHSVRAKAQEVEIWLSLFIRDKLEYLVQYSEHRTRHAMPITLLKGKIFKWYKMWINQVHCRGRTWDGRKENSMTWWTWEEMEPNRPEYHSGPPHGSSGSLISSSTFLCLYPLL